METAELKFQCCSASNGAVMGGFDVVEIWKMAYPTVGDPSLSYSLTTSYGNFNFLFVSQDNLNAFAANPWFYAPRYGGFSAELFCGAALSASDWADMGDSTTALIPPSDLSYWSFPDNQLFIFNSLEGATDYDGSLTAQCDQKWIDMFGSTQDGYFNTDCFTWPPAEVQAEEAEAELPAPQPAPEGSSFHLADVQQCVEDGNAGLQCCSDTSLPVLGGYDLIEVWYVRQPQVGSPEFAHKLSTSFGDFTFHFISEANRDMFAQDPWFFAPKYGGFDADVFCAHSRQTRHGIPTMVTSAPYLSPKSDLSYWSFPGNNMYVFSSLGQAESFDASETPSCDREWASLFHSVYDGVFNTGCFDWPPADSDGAGADADSAADSGADAHGAESDVPTEPEGEMSAASLAQQEDFVVIKKDATIEAVMTAELPAFSFPNIDQCMDSGKDALQCCSPTSTAVLGGLDLFSLWVGIDPVEGDPEYSYPLQTRFGTYTFWFASQQNLDVFTTSPTRFLPRFGGFDAARFCGAMSMNLDEVTPATAAQFLRPQADTRYWSVASGNLYLFTSEEDRDAFDGESHAACDDVWAAIFGAVDGGLFNTQCFTVPPSESAGDAGADASGTGESAMEQAGDVTEEGFENVNMDDILSAGGFPKDSWSDSMINAMASVPAARRVAADPASEHVIAYIRRQLTL
jgi:YHS domain-containing protein